MSLQTMWKMTDKELSAEYQRKQQLLSYMVPESDLYPQVQAEFKEAQRLLILRGLLPVTMIKSA